MDQRYGLDIKDVYGFYRDLGFSFQYLDKVVFNFINVSCRKV